jgi:GTP-binding protein EngB required for normal cell division
VNEPKIDWLRRRFEKARSEAIPEMGRLNIAIFGQSGVGKSTLVNAILGSDVASTGIGRPATKDSISYWHARDHIGFLDTRGLEIARDAKGIIAELARFTRGKGERSLSDQLHVAWYCIQSGRRRFEDGEAVFIDALRNLGIPVLIVLTQVPFHDGKYDPDALELKSYIDQLGLASHGAPAFPTYAKESPFLGLKVHGLRELLDETFRLASGGVPSAVTRSQGIEFEERQDPKFGRAHGLARRGQRPMKGHVFISYVREDSRRVDELQQLLENAGIPVWRDTGSLWPGEDWRLEIERAIAGDALVFIACFSRAGLGRSKSYQNEELFLAIEQLRLRRPDNPWLIPVRFDNCEVPGFDIGGGRTLKSLQYADLFGDGSSLGADRLVAVIRRIFGQLGDIND